VTAGCTHVLELPGVQTQGESVSDVRRMVGEAITFVLEERRISGELSRPGAESAGPEKACPELGNSEPFQPALTRLNPPYRTVSALRMGRSRSLGRRLDPSTVPS
jgi:predicted RNase H-like HicB family nuclease